MGKKDEDNRKYNTLTNADLKKMTRKEKEVHMLLQKSSTKILSQGVGWSPLEAALFYLVVAKYGAGQWEKAQYFLPHKNTAQINVFCQKLFGQQSLAAFSNLKLCPYEHYLINALAKDRVRKSGVVIHTGPALKTVQKKALKAEKSKRQILLNVELPIVEDRAQNYTKLFRQMDRVQREIEDELRGRGEWENAKKDDRKPFDPKLPKQFLEPLQKWPKFTNWKPGKEILMFRGQDNPYTVIRMPEDDAWLQGDQNFHWKFLSGDCFESTWDVDKNFEKKGHGRAYVPNAGNKKRWKKYESCEHSDFLEPTGSTADFNDKFSHWFEGTSKPSTFDKKRTLRKKKPTKKSKTLEQRKFEEEEESEDFEEEITMDSFAKFVKETKFVPSDPTDSKETKSATNNTSNDSKTKKSHYKGVNFTGSGYFAKRFYQRSGKMLFAPPGKTFKSEIDAAKYSDHCADIIRKKFPDYSGQKNFNNGTFASVAKSSKPRQRTAKKKGLYKWSTEELCVWLSDHKFPSKVVENVRKTKVTGLTCLHLEDAEFDKLEIEEDGGETPWTKVMMAAIRQFGTK